MTQGMNGFQYEAYINHACDVRDLRHKWRKEHSHGPERLGGYIRLGRLVSLGYSDDELDEMVADGMLCCRAYGIDYLYNLHLEFDFPDEANLLNGHNYEPPMKMPAGTME